VIDDFHYIDRPVQVQIVRALKDAVFEGLALILSAVPHRAYDAVRAEVEMTGRVELLEIPSWTEEELRSIAENGFAALNVRDPDGIVDKLVAETFGSPHLMQDFCLQICKQNEIARTQPSTTALGVPDWPVFFREQASIASKPVFDRSPAALGSEATGSNEPCAMGPWSTSTALFSPPLPHPDQRQN
jgi:hypothetical protein